MIRRDKKQEWNRQIKLKDRLLINQNLKTYANSFLPEIAKEGTLALISIKSENFPVCILTHLEYVSLESFALILMKGLNLKKFYLLWNKILIS
jgi:hypothetical protein